MDLGENQDQEDISLNGDQNRRMVQPTYMENQENTFVVPTHPPLSLENTVHILTLPNSYTRQELFRCQVPFIPYQPDHIQRGGIPQMMLTLENLSGICNNPNQFYRIRERWEGVLFNTQEVIQLDDFEDIDNLMSLTNLPLDICHIRNKASRCHVNHTDRHFITKEYCHDQWHSEEMEISAICGNELFIQPLGLIWNSHKIYIFLPEVSGKSLADIILKRKTLTPEEIKLLCYKILCGLKNFHSQDFMHRNINPNHVMISRTNQQIRLVGYGSLCRLDNSVSWLPLTTDCHFYCAPELANGTAHSGKCDVYSTGCTLLSAMTGKMPYFDINRDQVNDINYRMRIATGQINPQTYLQAMEQTPVVQMVTAMTEFNQYRRPSADEIITNYYPPIPQWRENYFGPRDTEFVHDPLHHPRPDLNYVAVLPQNGFLPNIPSEEILASADDASEEGEEEEEEQQQPVVQARLPLEKRVSVHSLDSGLNRTYTVTRDVHEVVVIVNDNGEIIRFPCEVSQLGAHIYRVVLSILNVKGGIKLFCGNRLLEFGTTLVEFLSPRPEIHFRLERLNQLETGRPEPHVERRTNDSPNVDTTERLLGLSPEARRQDIRNRCTQVYPDDRQSGHIQMGAAYNGDDHVVLEESPNVDAQKNGTLLPAPSTNWDQSDDQWFNGMACPDIGESENEATESTQLSLLSTDTDHSDDQDDASEFSHLTDTSVDFSGETVVNLDIVQTDEDCNDKKRNIQQHCREVKSSLAFSTTQVLVGICSSDSDVDVAVENEEDDTNREEQDPISTTDHNLDEVDDPYTEVTVQDTMNEAFIDEDSDKSDEGTEEDRRSEDESEGSLEDKFVENEEADDANTADVDDPDVTDAAIPKGEESVDEDEADQRSPENSDFEDSGVVEPGEASADISAFSEMNLNITDEAMSPIKEECPDLYDDEEELHS